MTGRQWTTTPHSATDGPANCRRIDPPDPGGPQRSGDCLDLSINGQSRVLDDAAADPAMPLLWALRDVLNLTGTKFGCGVAACGACTVLVDGQAV
ncbi:MAG: 2Fe-2S iron-sulfur cluster binding domain-containing protein, partial [Burkholderiales bacterium]|nr:2Fe-2S iron-sulfur cluster binding domain-containing protein [Burkholderiales bacterium]